MRSVPITEGGPTFPLSHRMLRALWLVTWFILARWTPPSMLRWRRFLLVIFGARLGSPCDVRGGAKVWYPPNLVMENWSMLASGVNCYNVSAVTVGRGTIVSQGAHLCTASHNIYDPDFGLISRPIHIGNQCWIGTEAFVGPGVTLGDGSVLGARAAAFKDLSAWQVYRGNPAVSIRERPVVQMMQHSQR